MNRLVVACWFALSLTSLLAHVSKPAVPFATGSVFGEAHRLGDRHARKAWAVCLEGDRLYVGGSGFLSVYDVAADPLNPRLLGTTEDMATVRQIAVQDGMAYVVARANGLWVVDCRSGIPRTVGHMPSTSNCTGVDVAGSVCFIGGSKSGIDFVDVSDPTRPQLIANRRLEPVESQSVAYRDGYLYSGEWGGRSLTVWDCRNLAEIKRVAAVPLVSNGDGVWPSGRWIYACTGWNSADKKPDAKPRSGQMGLTVFDCQDPSDPKEAGRVDFEYCKAAALDMWIPRASGSLVFCAQNISGLYAVDVSDPTHPSVVDRWTWTNAEGETFEKLKQEGRPSACVASVAVGDGVVYVAGPGDLGAWIIPAKGARLEPVRRGAPPVGVKLRPPPAPLPDGFRQWLPSDDTVSACVTGVAVTGDVCYAACGTAGLYKLSLKENEIKELAHLDLPECTDVSLAGNRLYVAAGRKGFMGYEINADGTLSEFLHFNAKGARDVYAYGDGRHWVAFNTTIYDVTDVNRPRPLVNLVHQARWNRFLGPDLFCGRWVIGNTALKQIGWADLLADDVTERVVTNYTSQVGAVCALEGKALLVDGGGWGVLEPGAVDRPMMKRFPKDGFSGGIPRACGSTVAISSGCHVGLWDFSNVQDPKHIRSYKLSVGAEPVSFWRNRIVVPGWTAGVLISTEGGIVR